MAERFLARSSALLLLFREGADGREILLQRRQHTGYADGHWECAASGHVEAGETMAEAAIREAQEELGIAIERSELRLLTLMHKYTPETGHVYYSGYFTALCYRGTPHRREPEKCAELRWFPLDGLPEGLLEDRRLAIAHALAGIPYSEWGWERCPGR